MALSLVWTVRGQEKGIHLGMLFGLLAVAAGITVFVKLGDTNGLIVDLSRGLLILITGYFARQSVPVQRPMPQPTA